MVSGGSSDLVLSWESLGWAMMRGTASIGQGPTTSMWSTAHVGRRMGVTMPWGWGLIGVGLGLFWGWATFCLGCGVVAD